MRVGGELRLHVDRRFQHAQRLGAQFMRDQETGQRDPVIRPVIAGGAALAFGPFLVEATFAGPAVEIHIGR